MTIKEFIEKYILINGKHIKLSETQKRFIDMLIEVRRVEKYPDLFPELYDDLYEALDKVQGNCFIRICKYDR